MCVCVCVCERARVCNYTIEKYKKNMCYHQKNNSNETKQNVYDYTIEKYKRKIDYLQKNNEGYNY